MWSVIARLCLPRRAFARFGSTRNPPWNDHDDLLLNPSEWIEREV